ncbi:MAG: T9SS type A sorting domain-containing protein [Bacteroidales bacterium]|nr:T9SS type A sorting domain-containing protein [Bacteroidales bacterium]
MKRLLSLLLILMLGMFSYQVSAQQNDGNMMPGNGAVTTDPIVTTAPVSNLMPNSATLNATITNPDNVNITEMGFEWKQTFGYNSSVPGTGNGNTFSATLNNLTPNTGYSYKAFITFDGTTLYGEEIYFSTPEEGSQNCPAPTNLIASPSASSVVLFWQQESNTANEWEVHYRMTTESTWSIFNTTSTTITLVDFISGADYEAFVVAHCANGQTSESSDTVTFHIMDLGIQDYLEQKLTLYPNPATELVSVATDDASIRITGVEVYNLYGQLLNAIVSEENPMRINVSGLADGMYFVRITTDSGVVTKSFVKR